MTIAAVGQLCSTASMAHNLEQCVRLISKAAAGGAKVLFLPEASDYIASSPQESLALAVPESQSPFVLGLQAAAKQHGVAVHVGIHVPVPVVEAAVATTKLLNRTIWIRSDGSIDPVANYDKLHLFDYGQLRESAHTQAGRVLTPPFDTAVGRVGFLTCFDMRFPEAATALAQPGPRSAWSHRPAQLLTYPSAFTVPTGRAHWEVLLRARAIEAQAYVVAAAQVGRHNDRRVSYGRSMVVDPWGAVLCSLGAAAEDGGSVEGDDDGAVGAGAGAGALGLVDIDLALWESVRERMPLLRRRDVFPEL